LTLPGPVNVAVLGIDSQSLQYQVPKVQLQYFPFVDDVPAQFTDPAEQPPLAGQLSVAAIVTDGIKKNAAKTVDINLIL